LSWSPITVYGPHGEQRPGLRVTVFLDAHGPVRVPTFDAFAEQARMRGEPLPPLVFDAVQGLPFHYDTPVAPAVSAERGAHLREQAEPGRHAATQAGHDSSATVGEYTSGAPVDDPDQTLSRRYPVRLSGAYASSASARSRQRGCRTRRPRPRPAPAPAHRPVW
jgi:hypothetical protein